MWKERHKNNMKTKINSNSPPKLDTSKSFYILPVSKTILSPPKQNILKTFLNRIPTFHLFLPIFVTYWQTQLKQTVNRKHMQQRSRENRESRKQMKSNNSLLLFKKQISPPIKIGKTKHVLGKNSFGEKLGGGDK